MRRDEEREKKERDELSLAVGSSSIIAETRKNYQLIFDELLRNQHSNRRGVGKSRK